jgi:hypothetical protein
MCAFHDALQAGKQKEVHRTPLIWRLREPDQGNTANKVNFFVSSILFVFWYHSPKFLDTPHTYAREKHTKIHSKNLNP